MAKKKFFKKLRKKPYIKKFISNKPAVIAVGLLVIVGGFLIYRALAKSYPTNNWNYWAPRIRACESGGTVYGNSNYKATSTSSSASGAYQFIDSTWRAYRGTYTQYARAKDAPASVQDAAAKRLFDSVGGGSTASWAESAGCWRNGGRIKSAPALPLCAIQDKPCSGSPSGGSSSGSVGGCPTGGDTSGSHPTVRKGNTGDCVKHLQYILSQTAKWRGSTDVNPGAIDGVFGSNTERAVKAYEAGKGHTPDGVVGSTLWSNLHASCAYMRSHPKSVAACGGTVPSSGGGSTSSSGCPGAKGDTSGTHSTIRYGSSGSCVQHAQYILTQIQRWRIKAAPSAANVDPKGVDGAFGNNTKTAVVNYQKGKGIAADGIVGPTTWKYLHGSCNYINVTNKSGSKTYGIRC